MKKMITIALVLVTATLFTSCKKDYSCTCVYHYPGDPDQTTVVTFHSSKSQATSSCNSTASAYQVYITDPGESYNCHL